MKKFLCTAISAAMLISSAFAANAELIPLKEYKGNAASNVTAEDIKTAIKVNSLDAYADKDVFLNAKTEDGRAFKDIVDTSLTVKGEKQGYILFTGMEKGGNTLYTAFYDCETKEADVEKVESGALYDSIIFDCGKAAEVINGAGLGKPTAMDRNSSGVCITTASGKYFYADKDCVDTIGKKMNADYYEMSKGKVYTYADYELWFNTRNKNSDAWQSEQGNKTVTTVDDKGDVIEVTPEPKATANPTGKPDSTVKPIDIPKATAAPEGTSAPTASPESQVLTVTGGAEITVTVGEKVVTFPDAKPFIDENDRTQVPVRAVAEMLDCNVDWDGAAQTAVISKPDGAEVKIMIGSKTLTVDGKPSVMDTAAVIKNDRTYIPVRFVAEALGLTVEWK